MAKTQEGLWVLSVNYLESHEGLLKECGGVEQSDLCIKEITLGEDSWGRDRRGSCGQTQRQAKC